MQKFWMKLKKLNKRCGRRAAILLTLVWLALASPALAHGVVITYTLEPVVTVRAVITATDLDGEPLNKADYRVFAPGTSDEAWMEGETGKDGRLVVVPDPALPGVWEIQFEHDDAAATLTLPVVAADDGVASLDMDAGVQVRAQGMALATGVTELVTVAASLTAKFDSGDVMDAAQVQVYAPDNAKSPWLHGVCDAEGHFRFVADVQNPGTWEVQVRQAGHGDWLKFELDETAVVVDAADSEGEDAPTLRIADEVAKTAASDDGYSTGQIVLMAACVVWGMVGTALYFSRRNSPPGEGDD